jgi:hypothetical protein
VRELAHELAHELGLAMRFGPEIPERGHFLFSQQSQPMQFMYRLWA